MANARVAERMAAQRKQYEEEEDKLQKQAVKQKAAAASASEKAFAQKEEAKQKAAERKAADLPSAADSSAKTSAKANSYTKTQQAQTAFETSQRAAEERRRAQQEEAKRKAAERKAADLPGYKPSGGLGTEEVKRLYNLDTEAEEERLSELKAKNIAEGGTVAAVNRGIRAGRTGTVDVDFSEAEEGRKQAEDLERDILLAKEIQRQAEWIKAQDSSEKMAEGREGFAKWEEDKKAKTEAERKEKENESFWDFIFGAMGSSPDTTLDPQLVDVAIQGFREDTSYKEPNDEWTYEQKRTFGYFYGKGDIKAAEEYAIEVNNAINRKKKEETLESVTYAATRNALSEILASAGTVVASPLSSVDILSDLTESFARGTVTEKADPSVFEMSQAVRGAIGEDINRKGGTLGEEWGALSGKGFGDLYQIGMGAADSLINAYAGGKAGALINAFGGSASGAVDDALKRGADADTALRYGLATGAAELFPEYLSIDSLFRLGSAKSVGGFLKNVGSQAASEGMEGAVTAISGALADDVIMGELSKFNTEVNAYMMDGYSREEAEQMAAKGGRIDIILDAVSEAIGGGMSGAAVTGVNSAFGRNTLSEETPIPFNGNAVTEEQKLVADKIAEIENRPVSEAEKAELMEAVLEVAQEENGSAEVIAEAEKFRDFHRQKELDRATEVANRLGNVVEFDDTIVGNGIHQEDGTIIINPNSKNPVMQVLVHELTHDIETSGLYGDFSQKVLNYAAEVQGIDLAKMEQMVISDYAKAGQKLDKTLADREIVAKFAEEHLFTDEKAIERLCNTEPTLFDRIKYWISDMAAKFRGTPEERFLRDAERLYEKALATRGEITGAGVEQHSIVNIPGKGQGVYLDTDLYDGLTDAERKQMLKARVKELGGQIVTAFDANGNAVDFKIVTNKRFINKNGKSVPANKDLSVKHNDKEVKQKAVDLIDELVLTSTPGKPKPAKHPHDWIDNNGQNNWEKWTANIVDKNNTVWEAELNIATSANGEKLLYDIDPIKIVGQASTLATSSPTPTLPQTKPVVNSPHSFGRGFDEMAAEAKTPFEKGEAEGVSAEETKTPSMERAAPNFDVQYWTGIAEGIDMESGIWRMKDFARVLDDAAGENKELRQRLYDLYEKPLNEAQGTYAKNYADKVESITEKFKELGIKAGSKESAAVQRIGEGVKEIDKNGNTTEYTLDDLKKDFPDSWESIKAGADYCRKVYDEFLNDLNAMYSEIYPATVEQANERVSNYDIRIENDAKYIDRYTEVIETLENRKTEKQIELSKKKPDSLIYAEIQNQIANIDHKIDVAERRIEQIKNRKLTKEISRDTLKAQIENGEILRNKQIKPRKDYFRHFQELTDEFAEIADIFSNDQRIPPNLAGKSATTKPRTIWTSIAQSRKNGNYYTEDAVSGLLKYTEIAEKLLVFDPLVSHFRDVNSAIRAAGTMVENEVKGKGTNAGQFAAWADDITNQLAGKTNKIDRIVSDNFGALGRSGIKAIEALNRRVKSNAILGNVRSALVQIGNLPNASLYIQNPKDWANGVISMLNDNVKNDPLIQEGRNRSKFMNRRYMGDTIDELTKEIQQNKILDKPKEFALWMLGAGDKLSAELIWHTAYTRALRNPDILSAESNKLRSYEDAVDYADDITRRSIGGRAEGDIPYFEESKITGLIAPFQIEVANTFNAFAEQGKKKNIAGLLAFEINVFLLNCVLEGITGDRPLGLDFIKVAWDIFNEAAGDDEEEEEKEAWDIVTYGLGRILGETLSSMPFGTQIAEFLTGGDEQKAEKWFGDSDPTRYGTGNIGMGALADAADYFIEGETPEEFYRLATEGGTVGEWAEPVLETVDTFAPLAMPWGGKQLSRSLRGIQQIAEGGAYGTEADGDRYLKFAQEYDPESIIKTVLFGQYASDAGQEYIDSGFSQKLSAKQTEQMEKAEALGMENGEFFDIIMGLKPYDTKEEKQKALLDMDIPVEDKNIIDAILFGGMTYKDIEGGRSVTERDYRGVEEFIVSGLDRKERILWDEDFSERDIERGMKALKDANTKEEKIEGLSDALKVEEDEAFRLIQKMEGNWIENEKDLSEEEKARAEGAAKLYDMSTEDFIAVLNYSKYGAQIVNEKGETEWSTKDEHVIPNVMRVTGWDEETAKKNLDIAKKYEFSRADLEEEKAVQLDTSAEWYGVEDDKFFVARNVLKTVEGEKDEYGKTISGTYKKAAINAIKEKLGVDESEATIYYLAASGYLILSEDDMETSQIEKMKKAVEGGHWTERQYMDAMNIIKVTGADSRAEITEALMAAGATREMANAYCDIKWSKSGSSDSSGGKSYSYGMRSEKQVTKGDYFIENYGNGEVTGKEISAWYAAASGCSKKQEYIDAYMSAGATFDQATKFYNLMRGYDRTFNAWYKENGG